uniref:Endonuclease/exonuclease/phosphatase domain-containing protein n=1 Tax=Canis lupus familiaris TaxID=9615 RepID=A0A8I3MZF9_CANLF
MMTLNSYLSIVTLNMNGLNDPIKRGRVSDWIKKQDPSNCCWRTIYHSNGPQKKAGIAIFISDKLKFIPKTVVRDEEGHYIMLTESVQQEDLTIMKIYASKVGAAKYINQLITKAKTYLDNTLIVGDFNMALSANDRSSKHNITKETRALNDTQDQMDFTDIYRVLHLNTTEYTFFSKIENLNRPLTREDIEAVIKNLPRHKRQGPDDLLGEFYQTFKEEKILILLKL